MFSTVLREMSLLVGDWDRARSDRAAGMEERQGRPALLMRSAWTVTRDGSPVLGSEGEGYTACLASRRLSRLKDRSHRPSKRRANESIAIVSFWVEGVSERR